MNIYPERRNLKRLNYISLVALKDNQRGHFIYGQMKNMSADGICFESDYVVKPGTLIDIAIDRLPYRNNRKKYRAIVRWYDVIDDDKQMYAYEIGAEFL